MSSFDYDMVIIGSGLDGSVAALRAWARLGFWCSAGTGAKAESRRWEIL